MADNYLVVALSIAACGLLLLFGEYFFATHGVLLVGGILCFFGACTIIGIYGTILELTIASIATIIAVPLSTYGAVMAWKRMFGGDPSPAAEASIAEMPEIAGLAEFHGRVGKTISQMRPSGVVEFEGRRIDAMSEGLMIDAGQWVKCVDIKSGKVIVRQVDINEPKPTVEAVSIPMPEPVPSPIPNPVAITPVTASVPSNKKPDLNNDDWQIS